jgi:nitrate reductase NapAB chaperone NapD
MHYSGILVVTRPQDVDECARRLAALPGVEVRCRYPESGRLIAVQETATAGAQEEGLRRIQALPRVAFAALVHHLIDPGTAPEAAPAAAPGLETGER